ncbi:MAG: FecR domain-containing protein [Leptospiraceae bacterium]|nr:FecR domain-containing protein [Leptospiraceae bacterium]
MRRLQPTDRRNDILVVLVCLFILATTSYSLYLDRNVRLDLGGEEVGDILFRRGEAHRRYASSPVWEEIRTGETVYNHNVIRTENASEAIVHLTNRTDIELDQQSMVRISVHADREIELNLLRGRVRVERSYAEQTLYLRHGNRRVFIESGALDAGLDGNGNLEVHVDGGRARIESGNERDNRKVRENANEAQNETQNENDFEIKNENESEIESEGESERKNGNKLSEQQTPITIESGQSALITVDETRLQTFSVRLIAPASGARMGADANPMPIAFQWVLVASTGSNGPGDVTAGRSYQVRLEISNHPAFEEIIAQEMTMTAAQGNAIVPLPPGTYYWRIAQAQRVLSRVERFSILERHDIRLISPAPREALEEFPEPDPEDGRTALVYFAWQEGGVNQNSAADNDGEYVIEVFRDPRLQERMYIRKVAQNSLTLPLPAGVYYWRVRSTGLVRASRTGASQVAGFRVHPPGDPRQDVALQIEKANEVAALLDAGLDLPTDTPAPVITDRLTDNSAMDVPTDDSGTNVAERHPSPPDDVNETANDSIIETINPDDQNARDNGPMDSNDSDGSRNPVVSTANDNEPRQVLPVILSPTPGATIDMAERDWIDFRWQTVIGAHHYILQLYAPDGELIHTQQIAATTLRFSELRKLSEGDFRWQLVSLNENEQAIRQDQARFTIVLSTQLDKPTILDE